MDQTRPFIYNQITTFIIQVWPLPLSCRPDFCAWHIFIMYIYAKLLKNTELLTGHYHQCIVMNNFLCQCDLDLCATELDFARDKSPKFNTHLCKLYQNPSINEEVMDQTQSVEGRTDSEKTICLPHMRQKFKAVIQLDTIAVF